VISSDFAAWTVAASQPTPLIIRPLMWALDAKLTSALTGHLFRSGIVNLLAADLGK
jgi:hypothetical protein